MADAQFSPFLQYRAWSGSRWRLRRLSDDLLEHGQEYASWSRRDPLIQYLDHGRRRLALLHGNRFAIRDPLRPGPFEILTWLSFTGWDNRSHHAAWDETARGFRLWGS